jgi:hypothetical protein
MKVYRLKNDVNHYQYFLPADRGDLMALATNCRPRAATWSPPEVFVYMPLLEAGDFYQFGVGTLIASPRATEVLRGFFQESGELLPLPFEGQEYTVHNITLCINCLDQQRSTWLKTAEGERIYPTEYVFHPDRFADSALFKIPETHLREVLVVEGLRDPEDEFRAVVERAGLKGLIFQEIWSNGP